jgi:hypothetical protein
MLEDGGIRLGTCLQNVTVRRNEAIGTLTRVLLVTKGNLLWRIILACEYGLPRALNAIVLKAVGLVDLYASPFWSIALDFWSRPQIEDHFDAFIM